MLSCIVGVKSINSFDYEEAKLREWSNKEILKCPECGERVIYCKGDYKVPYFKHEVGSECEGNSFSEPMTNEHIDGIAALYNRLKEIEGVENLEVEKYIANTKQRPDIYFEYKSERYCIEYQCSPISTEYNKRHELYELEGINDIWILGTEKYNFEAGKNHEECFVFTEKRIKAIENEIDGSESPLVYFDGVNMLKVNKNGFRPIIRNEYKYLFDNSPLKTIVGLTLSKVCIEDIDIEFMTVKENKSVNEIVSITHETIKECEKLVEKFKKDYSCEGYFRYNLSMDRFPMYEYKLDYMWCKEYYDIYCGRFIDDMDKILALIKKRNLINNVLKELELIYEEYNLSYNGYRRIISITNKKYKNIQVEIEDYDGDIEKIKDEISTIYLNKKSKVEEYEKLIIEVEKIKIDLNNFVYGLNVEFKNIVKAKISVVNCSNLEPDFEVICTTKGDYIIFKKRYKSSVDKVIDADIVKDELMLHIDNYIISAKIEHMIENMSLKDINIGSEYEHSNQTIVVDISYKGNYTYIYIKRSSINVMCYNYSSNYSMEINEFNILDIKNIIHNEIRRLRYGSI